MTGPFLLLADLFDFCLTTNCNPGGWGHLKDSIEAMKGGPFTALVWPLQGEDPDDAFSSVPYEKGYLRIFTLSYLSVTVYNCMLS